MGFEERLKKHLAERHAKGLYRKLPPFIPVKKESLSLKKGYINLAGNDYLGLSRHPSVREAAAHAALEEGAGNCSSRLITGNSPAYTSLEKQLGSWLSREILIFGSGFLANAGILSTVARRGDIFFADRLVHQSIIGGMRLSGAAIERFAHNDPADLERILRLKRARAETAFIVTESLFSMTGDTPPWEDIIALKKKYDCQLYVDEAHSIGVLGPSGKGLAAQAGCLNEVDIMMGTFGKGWGNFGAFFAGSALLKEYLVNFSPTLIYSTALPPSILAGIERAFHIIAGKEGENLRQKLRHNIRLFTGNYTGNILQRKGKHQINALIAGNIPLLRQVEEHLKLKGFWVTAIRPPTVPAGMEMIRLSLNALLTPSEITGLNRTLNNFSAR